MRSLVIVVFVLTFSGCQLGYYFKSAKNQLSMMSNREPIDEILKSNRLTDIQKNKLRLAQQAREFAFNDLQLKQTDNYDTYIDLKRPYVTWVVNAAYKWELKNYLWSYPIVGKMPYKGFFSEDEAKEEAQTLQLQGLDTNVRGVSAYSTLGWFKDSVLSSMLRYNDHDLVNTIIHELTHTTVYIKHNADFNERLAVFVGNKGTELFYKKVEGENSPTLKKITAEYNDDKLFSDFISEEIKNLEDWYKSKPEQNELLRQKQFEKIKNLFKSKVSPNLKTDSLNRFLNEPMNNATLGLLKTYMEDLSDFEKLYTKSQNNLTQFLEQIRLLQDEDDPVSGLKKLIK